ncbi:hypothetical protein [Heyndrickxia acidicola]|uniref:Uncharacterized protein n=1 Tax=Heyndrickxia acidicola TaxID=209389 RepID=A0ABU6MFJ4_9BACI|nr:hypothetical protein [Heyndrickxia acidicola]MED1202806.1 hypothetical protein [Heyndrickxia acidicola]
MGNSSSSEIKRGQTIAFRIPSDTPDHILKQIQKLKETEKRNFSSRIAEFVMQGVNQTFTREREALTIPIPQKLSKMQKDWLKHEHSEALLGSIMYHLIADPVRSVSLLAALNSNHTDIDQALYLQEEAYSVMPKSETRKQVGVASPIEEEQKEHVVELQPEDDIDDDLDQFDWDSIKPDESLNKEQTSEKEETLDDLLGGFLAQMNK